VVELAAVVGGVAGLEGLCEELVDEREKVGNRPDGAEGRGIEGTGFSASDGEGEGVVDGREGDGTLEEVASEASVKGGSAAGRIG
jgi:hypothetical protein